MTGLLEVFAASNIPKVRHSTLWKALLFYCSFYV